MALEHAAGPSVPEQATSAGGALDLGYGRVSTTKQHLERQLASLSEAGIPYDRVYVDKKPAPPSTDPA